MDDLLQIAVGAHGGLERWHQIMSRRVAAAITAAIWFVKSQGDYLKVIVMTLEPKRERLVTEFPGQDKRYVFHPVSIPAVRGDPLISIGSLCPARCHDREHWANHRVDGNGGQYKPEWMHRMLCFSIGRPDNPSLNSTTLIFRAMRTPVWPDRTGTQHPKGSPRSRKRVWSETGGAYSCPATPAGASLPSIRL